MLIEHCTQNKPSKRSAHTAQNKQHKHSKQGMQCKHSRQSKKTGISSNVSNANEASKAGDANKASNQAKQANQAEQAKQATQTKQARHSEQATSSKEANEPKQPQQAECHTIRASVASDAIKPNTCVCICAYIYVNGIVLRNRVGHTGKDKNRYCTTCEWIGECIRALALSLEPR